jgi:hypothetical protein
MSRIAGACVGRHTKAWRRPADKPRAVRFWPVVHAHVLGRGDAPAGFTARFPSKQLGARGRTGMPKALSTTANWRAHQNRPALSRPSSSAAERYRWLSRCFSTSCSISGNRTCVRLRPSARSWAAARAETERYHAYHSDRRTSPTWCVRSWIVVFVFDGISRLNGFLPLTPMPATSNSISSLATDSRRSNRSCRTDKAELARHKVGVLLPDELHNLGQWDYPFVFERSRFHLDQSGRVEARAASMTQGKAVA